MDLIFTTAEGHPLRGTAVTGRFLKRMAEAGLPSRRFHELRHGFASLMLAHGVVLRVMLKMLAHSRLHTTATVYTHVVPELQREAMPRLDRAIG